MAETAAANKRSIYVHFGTKEELFDIVVADSMVKLAQSISFEDEYRKRISAIESAQQPTRSAPTSPRRNS
ncbi:TetR family transcriptional regulator [Streptomyces sp. NPDC020747]|uniref:TetR family transcriptional regulator n=1 Tax=Streptomyces sp. NPDC020747 TaxID=3365086 RepID=UPI0037AB7C98